MLSVIFFLGLNGFFGGIGNFINGLFGIQAIAPDPPQVLGTYGNAFDLPNSNVVELPPTLPSAITPISVNEPTNPFSNFFGLIGSSNSQPTLGSLSSGSILGSQFINNIQTTFP